MPNNPGLIARLYPVQGATATKFSISNKAITTNLATITTSAAHGITQVGTIVTIEGVDTTHDGIRVIQSIPTTTTFTYVSTTATQGSAAVSPVGIATFNTGASGVTNGFLVTNKVVQNNIATLTTGSAHGLVVNDVIAVTIGDAVYDGTQIQVIAVPTSTTFSYIVTTTTAASTAVTQGAYGRYPNAYTVPAATTAVVTNILITNTSASAATFSICLQGICIAWQQTIAANSTAYFDLKQVLTTGQTIMLSASSQRVNAQISGMIVN